MSSSPNGNASGPKPVRVSVNGRALVDKVLARYPEEFTGECACQNMRRDLPVAFNSHPF